MAVPAGGARRAAHSRHHDRHGDAAPACRSGGPAAGAADPERPRPAPEVINQQIAAYPEIRPLFLSIPADEAHRKALALVGSRGWEVVAADEAGRRIEATDTTFWFRFKDDVALRVSAVPDGTSRVDMRSVSRIGRSDIGTNARRIRDFLADLAR
ncbi:MAG: DUF1499 domain-containing protein [Vicinamibacterales bacterium]